MSGDKLHASIHQYLQAAGMDMPPPPIYSDPLVSGTAPIEQVLRMLGLAANWGDPQDSAEHSEEHARRHALTIGAAEHFAAQDEAATAELDVTAQAQSAAQAQSIATAQQLPQTLGGIAAALGGALGGVLQPLAQIPQQVAQGAQQLLQSTTGLLGDAGGSAAMPIDDAGLGAPELWEELDTTADDFGYLGTSGGPDSDIGPVGPGGVAPWSGGGGGLGSAVPATPLGPAPIPSASTAPSSAPAPPVNAPRSTATMAPAGAGFAGMPMVPPGAMGTAANSDRDAKADTKRVSVPPVRNGAPVQGRLIPPASPPPVARKLDGKPVAARRIVATDGKTDGDAGQRS